MMSTLEHTAGYYVPQGGLPAQHELLSGRAVTTESYAVIPRGVQTDIVTSLLPHWENTRLWVLARPMSGFSTTFSHYLMEVSSNGGSELPESNPAAEGVLFVVDGELELTIEGEAQVFVTGAYAWLAPGTRWSLRNRGADAARFHWLRKRYDVVEGIEVPATFVTHESAVDVVAMPDTEGAWTTTRFVDPLDIRHDMHVNIVSFAPGASIPFAETHVMEHGLYMLEGKAVYRLNQDWVEVEAGDYIWLRAFCPQACYAGGPGRFRYLLYKDVNRHMDLSQ